MSARCAHLTTVVTTAMKGASQVDRGVRPALTCPPPEQASPACRSQSRSAALALNIPRRSAPHGRHGPTRGLPAWPMRSPLFLMTFQSAVRAPWSVRTARGLFRIHAGVAGLGSSVRLQTARKHRSISSSARSGRGGASDATTDFQEMGPRPRQDFYANSLTKTESPKRTET